MPILRACTDCGQKYRVPVEHLAHHGRCGACKAALERVAEPLEGDPELFNDEAGSRDDGHNPLLLGLTSMLQNESSHSGM